MKDVNKIRDYQQTLFKALGKDWSEEYFHEHWILTISDQEWDKIAMMGLLKNDFCFYCGNPELKSGYIRTPNFSMYKISQPICDECWERKGFDRVSNNQRKSKIKIKIGCLLFSIIIIWLVFL